MDYKSLAELRHQIRRFLHFSEQAARNMGLEPRQHQLMLAIKGCRTECVPESANSRNACRFSTPARSNW